MSLHKYAPFFIGEKKKVLMLIAFILPQNKILRIMYDIVTNELFEIAILGIIMLNMSIMMWQHYDQPRIISDTLHILFSLIYYFILK